MIFAPLPLRGLLFAAPANETMLALRPHLSRFMVRYVRSMFGCRRHDSISHGLHSAVQGYLTLLPMAEEMFLGNADSLDPVQSVCPCI